MELNQALVVDMNRYVKALLIAASVYALLIVFFGQLYFPKWTSKLWHEIAGTVVFILVVMHLCMMRSIFSYFKKQTAPFFIYRDIILVLMLLDFIAVTIFGMALSKNLYVGLVPIDKAIARQSHTSLAIYMYILIGMHLGCYLYKLLIMLNDVCASRVQDKAHQCGLTTSKCPFKGAKAPGNWILLLLHLIAINGFIELCKPYYWDVLLWQYRKLAVDRERSYILNTIDQVSITILFMVLSFYISRYLLLRSTKKEPKAKAA